MLNFYEIIGTAEEMGIKVRQTSDTYERHGILNEKIEVNLDTLKSSFDSLVDEWGVEFDMYSCEDCKKLHEENCSGTFEICDNFVDFRKESVKKVCKICQNDVFFVKAVYREELEEDDYGSWIEEVLDYVELECYNCGEKEKI